MDAKALGFFGEGCARNVSQEGCTGLRSDVVGKAGDVDGDVQGTTWDASTEAVSSGTDAGIVASADSAFSGFQCIGTGQSKGGSHGRDLSGGKGADHRNEGEDAEDGEQKRHAIHITGDGWRGKRFLKKV